MPFTFCQMFSQPSSPEICGAFRISNRRALAGFRIDTVARIEKRYSPLAVEHIMVRLRHNLGLALLLAGVLCLALGESRAQTAAPPSATPATGAHPQKTDLHGKKAAPQAQPVAPMPGRCRPGQVPMPSPDTNPEPTPDNGNQPNGAKTPEQLLLELQNMQQQQQRYQQQLNPANTGEQPQPEQ